MATAVRAASRPGMLVGDRRLLARRRQWRPWRQNHIVVGASIDRAQFAAGGRHRCFPGRRHNPSRRPRRIDRRGILPGLPCRQGVDGRPGQRWRGADRAVPADGPGVPVRRCGQLEHAVGSAERGPAGGGDRRGSSGRQGRMRLTIDGVPSQARAELRSGVHKTLGRFSSGRPCQAE